MPQNEINLSSESLIELIRSTLSTGASFRFQVKGSSMTPFIKDSDIVILSPISNNSLGLGVCAAFVNPVQEKLVVHRITGKSKTGFIMKGDAIHLSDGSIPQENILGVVTSIERDKRLIRFGLGSEKSVIALLSRLRVLTFCFCMWMLIPLPMRKAIKCKIRT